MKDQLQRTLTLFPTTTIVIGSVVGCGIFISSAGMARSLGSAPLLLFVWALAGLMTFFGALTQCELAAQMPETGGMYEYFKTIYGDAIGFLYGWANFTIAGSGAIAGLAYICVSYFGEFCTLPHFSPALEAWPVHLPLIGTLYPLANIGSKALGSLLILILTYLNVRGVQLGSLVQSIATSAKVLAIIAVMGVAFIFGGESASFSNWVAAPQSPLSGWGLVGAVSLALSGAFWAYDGWGNVSFIAGEVRDPERTIPRALLLGTACFVGLYFCMNLAYLYVFPVEALGQVSGDRVASVLLSSIFGPRGAMCIAALIILSTFDTTNSSILTNARVYYAMAGDHRVWRRLGGIHPRYKTPHRALWYQGLWSVVLLVSGSFESIASMYIFANWSLYVLMAVGLFILRFRNPKAVRPFKVPGYPWVPAIFAVFSLVYVVVTLVTDIQVYRAGESVLIQSLAGLMLVAIGVPFYFLGRKPG